MKVGARAYRTIWLNDDGWGVDVIDQRWLPHDFRIATLRSMPDAADRHSRHVGPRRSADRRGGGLWLGARHARRSGRRRARWGLGGASRDAPDRDQPALGARCGAQSPATARSPGARRRRLCPGGGNRRRGRRHQPRHRQERARDHPPDRRDQEARRAGQPPHPLQRRLARDGRLRHRHRADLSRDGGGSPCPRLCRRNPPPQSGRVADGVGAGQPRRAAYARRRQRRRSPDAARPASTW